MIVRRLSRWALAGVCFVAGAVFAADEKALPGVGPNGEIKKVHTGSKFTEGPIGDADGNVYFSDIPNELIHKIDAAGKVTAFREKSNNANGLMINAKGEVVACEMQGAIVALSADGKQRRVIADKYDDKRFNAPNDLVLDKAGGVYFTDPGFRAPTPLVSPSEGGGASLSLGEPASSPRSANRSRFSRSVPRLTTAACLLA